MLMYDFTSGEAILQGGRNCEKTAYSVTRPTPDEIQGIRTHTPISLGLILALRQIANALGQGT
jgi:hypothetical protein